MNKKCVTLQQRLQSFTFPPHSQRNLKKEWRKVNQLDNIFLFIVGMLSLHCRRVKKTNVFTRFRNYFGGNKKHFFAQYNFFDWINLTIIVYAIEERYTIYIYIYIVVFVLTLQRKYEMFTLNIMQWLPKYIFGFYKV